MDMSDMMKGLPDMLGNLKEMQAKMDEMKVTGSAGGGMVEATLNGTGELLAVKIEKDVVDPEDVEMLQDLIVAAVADAKKNVAKNMKDQMSSLTGGLDLSSLGINLPGMG
jgi:hypothetical protein